MPIYHTEASLDLVARLNFTGRLRFEGGDLDDVQYYRLAEIDAWFREDAEQGGVEFEHVVALAAAAGSRLVPVFGEDSPEPPRGSVVRVAVAGAPGERFTRRADGWCHEDGSPLGTYSAFTDGWPELADSGDFCELVSLPSTADGPECKPSTVDVPYRHSLGDRIADAVRAADPELAARLGEVAAEMSGEGEHYFSPQAAECALRVGVAVVLGQATPWSVPKRVAQEKMIEQRNAGFAAGRESWLREPDITSGAGGPDDPIDVSWRSSYGGLITAGEGAECVSDGAVEFATEAELADLELHGRNVLSVVAWIRRERATQAASVMVPVSREDGC